MTKKISGVQSVLFLCTLLSLLACIVVSPVKGEEGLFGEEKFKAGDKAVDFTTVDLEGKQVTLSSYFGSKTVLLNFWGLRCGACIEEMPHLNALNTKYGEQGLVILGVDTDGVDIPVVVSTMKEVGINPNFTILTDTDFTITDTYTNFLVPLTIIIDKTGVIRYIHTGFESGDEKAYDKAVAKVLKQ